MERLGKTIIVLGIVIVVIGLLLWLLGDKLRFLGRLPGDIRIEKKNFSVYIPITSMILISILLSLVFWLIQKLK